MQFKSRRGTLQKHVHIDLTMPVFSTNIVQSYVEDCLVFKRKPKKAPFRPDRPTKKVTSGVLARTKQLEEAMGKDNFVECRTRALGKGDPGYGRPQEGTRTAERGRRAQTHVHKEILELCEVRYQRC